MSAAEANANCLAGMACPGCGTGGPFRVAVAAWATVTDDGADTVDEVAWDDDSPCLCPGCGHIGIVLSFRRPPVDLGARYLAAVTRPVEVTGDRADAVRALLNGTDSGDPRR